MGIILYLLGLIVLVSGLAWLATLIGIAQSYIGGAALLMLGSAVVSAFVIARLGTQEPA